MRHILVAPFSNSDIRDWPLDQYAAMIGLLLERIPADIGIRVTGAPGQWHRACEVVRRHPADRVSNDCGRYAWGEVVRLLRAAECMIGNNSGLAHLGGHYGVPTVCVFGGSHQRHEWRPTGPSVALVSRAIGCSPCHLDHGGASPYAKACLREIAPEAVASAAVAIMHRAGRAIDAGGRAREEGDVRQAG